MPGRTKPLPALLLLPLVLTLAVLLDTPFHALPDRELSGLLPAPVRPSFSSRSFWEGHFQRDFEAWLEERLSLKDAIVRSDNTLNLVLFRDISAHTRIPIVLGEHHTLFEMNYINNHNGVSELKGDPPPRSPYSVEESTRLISRVARAFRLLGVDFMFVFYPCKASIWSDRVRPSYLLPGGAETAAAGYQRLLSGLKAAGVPVVDGAAEFSRIARENPSFPLYNGGGTHWTDAGACEVARRMVDLMPLANPTGSTLRCRLGRPSTAQNVDADLAQLINVWDNSRFLDAIPSVTPSLSTPLAGGARDALIVGTSYSDHLTRELQLAGVLRNVYRLSYYRHTNADTIEWRRVIPRRRVVVLEQWQWSYFTVNITEFIDDLAARVPRFAQALERVGGTPASRAASAQ